MMGVEETAGAGWQRFEHKSVLTLRGTTEFQTGLVVLLEAAQTAGLPVKDFSSLADVALRKLAKELGVELPFRAAPVGHVRPVRKPK